MSRTVHLSQAERLLARACSGIALHQDDFNPPQAVDGGSPIRAVRSRISDLESEGYGFHHRRRPNGTTEYVLAHIPERPAPRPTKPGTDEDPAAEQLALELPPPARTRPGLFDVDEAA